MTAQGFAAELQREIEPLQARVIFHPLYQAIYDGQLPVHVLREYAKQAYLWKAYALELMPLLMSKSPPDVRRLLVKNLASEEGFGDEPPHLELLIDFGEEIGLGREDFQRAEPILEVDALQNFYARVFYGGTIVEAAAAFNLAFEGLLARKYPRIARALKERYRLGPKGLRFWQVHVEADAEHSGDGAYVLDRYADTPELKTRARRAATVGLEHRWVAAEGIYRRFGAA